MPKMCYISSPIDYCGSLLPSFSFQHFQTTIPKSPSHFTASHLKLITSRLQVPIPIHPFSFPLPQRPPSNKLNAKTPHPFISLVIILSYPKKTVNGTWGRGDVHTPQLPHPQAEQDPPQEHDVQEQGAIFLAAVVFLFPLELSLLSVCLPICLSCLSARFKGA